MNQSFPLAADVMPDDDRVFAELLDRVGEMVEEGELAAAEALIESHPQHADRLHRAIAAIEALAAFDSLPSESASATPHAMAPAPNEQTLGDFRILREIGRGGMGVVYEAIQISLGRRVALKVLPYAALLDARQLERFLNEARVAAGLHHTHIVPVYTVGSERGVYFYAMQFIAGRDLADVIGELRTAVVRRGDSANEVTGVPDAPTVRDEQALIETPRIQNALDRFRQAAAWAADAADALSYAHSVGVLHRDIKPANLLVDEAGAIWISDFGLARFQTDASLSGTGEVLGTLRYMSPEQARGDRTAVGARSDVYSLGVTLYELLTLQPTFPATDRAQLLADIADREPPPVRRIDPRVPADLAAIVHKAMEKGAPDRYSSAEALAADLRHFLAHRTIAAQPPTLVQRARKWARRHMPVVQVAAAATIVLAVGGVAATALTLRAYRSEARQHAAATANLRVASDSIDRMLSRVADDRYFHGDLDHAETVAIDAAEFYDKLLVQSDDPEVQFRAAHAQAQVADIWVLVGQYEKAQQAYARSIGLARPLIAAFPAEAKYIAARAYGYQGLGESAWGLHRAYDALEPFQQAAVDYQFLIDRFPTELSFRQGLANGFNNLGMFALVTNHWDDADDYLRRAADLTKQFPDELTSSPTGLTNAAGLLSNQALLAFYRKDLQRAASLLAEAVAVQQRSLNRWPDNPVAADALYKQYWSMGETSLRAGQPAAAAQAAETLILAFPDRLDAHVDAAKQMLSCAALADMDQWRTQGLRSDVYRKRAGSLIAQAIDAPVRTPEAVDHFAWFLLTSEDEWLRNPPLALELAMGVVAEVPERGGVWLTLALAHYRNGDWQSADDAVQKSIKFPHVGRGNAYDWALLAMIRFQQGRLDEARHWRQKGTDWIAGHQPEDKELIALTTEADRLIPAE